MYAFSQQCGGKCLAMMSVVSDRVEVPQQPQGKRVSRHLQGVTISAATECEYLGISLGVTISIWQ